MFLDVFSSLFYNKFNLNFYKGKSSFCNIKHLFAFF